MGNKLKSIFSTQMFELGGNIRFKDIESSKKFAEALNILYDTGQPIEIDGVESISTNIKNGSTVYPPLVHPHIEKVLIFPHKESVPLKIAAKSGTKTITLYRYQTTKEIIIETAESGVVYLKLAVLKGTLSINFTYRMQLTNAKSVKDVAESLYDALGILNTFFGSSDAQNVKSGKKDFVQMIKSFKSTAMFFDKLSMLENKLNVMFNPQKMDNIDEDLNDVYELYLLLIEKKPVRLNAKLTATSSTGITIADDSFERKLGAPISLTFGGETTYVICGQNICIYTANLLTNAIIKEFETDRSGAIKILYGDTDSNPMYICYRGFTSKSAATKERKKIMDHRTEYENAQTIEKYIMKCNE